MWSLKRNKPKFNVIFDLDNTIIEPKSKGDFPKDEHDWQFKPHMLEVMLAIYTNNGTIAIYSNNSGVTFGYLKPNQVEEMMVDILDNICTFIENETGDSIKKITNKLEVVQVMAYNSLIRKGADYCEDVYDNLRVMLGMNDKINVFIGDGSGLNLEVNTKGIVTPQGLKTLHTAIFNKFNCKVNQCGGQKFELKSKLKSDIVAARNLDCEVYFDEGLFISTYNFNSYSSIFYSLGQGFIPMFSDSCPNLLTNVDDLVFECGLVESVKVINE